MECYKYTMKYLNAQDFKSVCRTCAKKSNTKMYDLNNDAQISDWIKENTTCNATDKLEDLPTFICRKCFKHLDNYFKFKAKALKSLETLIAWLENEKVSSECSFEQDNGETDVIEQFDNIEIMMNATTGEMDTNDIFDDFFEVLSESTLDVNNDTNVETNLSNQANQNIILQQNEPNQKSKKTSFKCHICFKRCNKLETFSAHLRGHEGLKPYKCSQCDCAYNHAYELRMHTRDLHSTMPEEFMCLHDNCGQVFRRQDYFRAHLRNKHAEYSEQQQNDVKRRYMCEECGRTFKYKTTLEEHKYRHLSTEQYPHACPHCNKRFITMRHFNEHLLRHVGIKQHECPYCGMKKTTQRELRVHINYHTKERQWQCPSCSSVFNNSANLSTHVRNVHEGIRRFICRFCNESFAKPDTLKHHEMRHTGEKPHNCDICEKRFIQVVALRAHMKTHKQISSSHDNKDTAIPLAKT